MISDRIKEVRKNNNMLQRELADKLGLTNKAISSYENGISQPTVKTIIKMSEIFNVSLAYFLEVEQSSLDAFMTLKNEVEKLLPNQKSLSQLLNDFSMSFGDEWNPVDMIKFIIELTTATDDEKRKVYDYVRLIKIKLD